MIAYIHWDVSPEVFLYGPITIRWYGLLFASSFLIGYYLMQAIYKRENKPLANLDALLWHVILGTVIGARLGHCLFYEPEYYLSNPCRNPQNLGGRAGQSWGHCRGLSRAVAV